MNELLEKHLPKSIINYLKHCFPKVAYSFDQKPVSRGADNSFYVKRFMAWRFALMWWPAYAGVVFVAVAVRHVFASSRICEQFDLESPNLARTSTQVGSTTTPGMTSLITSGRKLSWKKPLKCRLRRLRVRFLEKGSSENNEIIQTYRWLSAHKPGRFHVTSFFQSTAKYK